MEHSAAHLFRGHSHKCRPIQRQPLLHYGFGSTAAYIVDYGAATCRPKGLNGKCFTLFHLGLVRVLDERDRLAAMNVVLVDVMRTKVSDGLDRVSLPTNLDLVTLHGFLDSSAHVADTHIYSSSLYKCQSNPLQMVWYWQEQLP